MSKKLWTDQLGGVKPSWLNDEEKSRCYCDDRGWVLVNLDGSEEVLVAGDGLNDPDHRNHGTDSETGLSNDPDRISLDSSAAVIVTSDSPEGQAIIAGSDSPIQDPLNRDGWYYESTGSKIHWYFFNGDAQNVPLSSLNNLYSVTTVDAAIEGDSFHFNYYTKPQGDGDASWYRSRITYVPIEPFDRGVKSLFWAGEPPAPELHPELPRVQMQISTVSPPVGPQDPSEELWLAAYSTSSAAAAGDIKILTEYLGVTIDGVSSEYELKY